MKDFLSVLRVGGLAGGGIVYLIYLISPALFLAGPNEPLFSWASAGLVVVYLCCYGLMACNEFVSRVRYIGAAGVSVINGAGAIMLAWVLRNELCPEVPLVVLALGICVGYAGICWPVYSQAQNQSQGAQA